MAKSRDVKMQESCYQSGLENHRAVTGYAAFNVEMSKGMMCETESKLISYEYE